MGGIEDLPKWKQKELRDKHNCDDFDALYNFYVPGFNLRATDLQAFIGLVAIDKLDSYSQQRNTNFKYYMERLQSNRFNFRVDDRDFISNFAMPILKRNRKSCVDDLISSGVEVRPLIAGNMANKPMWVDKYGPSFLAMSNMIEQQGFYVPNHQDLKLKEIIMISDIINKYE